MGVISGQTMVQVTNRDRAFAVLFHRRRLLLRSGRWPRQRCLIYLAWLKPNQSNQHHRAVPFFTIRHGRCYHFSGLSANMLG